MDLASDRGNDVPTALLTALGGTQEFIWTTAVPPFVSFGSKPFRAQKFPAPCPPV